MTCSCCRLEISGRGLGFRIRYNGQEFGSWAGLAEELALPEGATKKRVRAGHCLHQPLTRSPASMREIHQLAALFCRLPAPKLQ